MDIKKLAKEQQSYVVANRRKIHENPELSGKEQDTRHLICKELEKLHIPYDLLEGTGLIAKVEGTRPGPTRVVRADIDALPIQESTTNLRQTKQCVSTVPGVMHACGHDAHTAILLGTLRALAQAGNDFPGTLLACFEEGEECGYGIEPMLDALEKRSVDEVFALHVQCCVPAGYVNIEPGPRMAGALGIGVTFHGRSGHGSRPDQAISPIIPACHFVTQANSAFMNQLDVEKTVTLGFGKLVAGDANNVIPSSAYVGGSARFFDHDEGVKAEKIIWDIAENTARTFRCSVNCDSFHGAGVPVINDKDVANSTASALAEACGSNVLVSAPRWFASESFSMYLQRYPGALGFLGIKNDKLGSGAPHHNEKFDIDEKGLWLGVAAELCFITRP